MSSKNPFATDIETVDLARKVADEVKNTTCYMCACRCGIRVYLRNGKVRYIEGNPNHPVNKGVLCAKGSAGIMNHYSPARLQSPLLRVGKRGEGVFKEISWDEALKTATDWLAEVRAKNPNKLAFYTGRDQSQSLTGWWAAKYGTVNFASHGGFCSVNMAAAGLYTVGGAFWEFGEPDWERTRYFVLLGVAEDHDSNPIKIGMGKLKTRKETKIVSINPVQTGYSAIADEWLGIRPGTDGLLILSLIHELLRAEAIDFDYLRRYTNAPWLVIHKPGAKDDGLFARNADGKALVYDSDKKCLTAFADATVPALLGEYQLEGGGRAIPVFALLARKYLDKQYAAQAVAEKTGIRAAVIRRIAAEIAEVAFSESITIEQPWTDFCGRKHDAMVGRPVSFHAMRGISAHSNGFHTCRAIHLLQILIGSIDVPGGWRYKPPYPKDIPAQPKPAKPVTSGQLAGLPLGNPSSPEDLLVNSDGTAQRLDKGYSWEFPFSAHGLMHMTLHNAWAGDPYPIDLLFMYMANMAWNSSMNTSDTIKYLTDTDENGNYKIPKFIYSDAYYSETVAYADLVLPDTTYLERYDCISLLDRPISHADSVADAIRQPVVEPERDVRPFQDVLIELGARLRLPGFVNRDGSAKYPGLYADYMVNHERQPGIGPLAGWRGDGSEHGKGDVNPQQIIKYTENECYWSQELAADSRFYKNVNSSYLSFAHAMGWRSSNEPVILQLYSEELQKFRLCGLGQSDILPPPEHRQRLVDYCSPLPIWYPPFEETVKNSEKYPLHAITQRPMHMYHSWGSQNAWLRQITHANVLYVHPHTAQSLGISDGGWAELENELGKVTVPVRYHYGVNKSTVWTWNAIGKRRGAWGLKNTAPEANQGFLLNHLIHDILPATRQTNADPVTGQAAWYDLRVKLRPCAAQTKTSPLYEPLATPLAAGFRKVMRFGKDIQDESVDRQTEAGEIREWIGNRQEYAKTVQGIQSGYGNATTADTRDNS